MKTIAGLFHFLVELIRSRHVLMQLVRHDFRQEYLGSYLGIIWAFANPLVSTVLLWFVFSVGFKAAPVQDFPFILWLVCGLFPWQFLTGAGTAGTQAVRSQAHLVNKVVFRVSLLPIVKIGSTLIIHAVFVGLMLGMFVFMGKTPGWAALQIVYYLFCALVLMLGFTWLSSSLAVFVPDLSNAVNLLFQVGFWATPVFWSSGMMPEKFQKLLKLNPFFYITEGYRHSLITSIWFWETPVWTVYFWVVTAILFVAGAFVFSKLRPHFADVL